MSFDAPWSDLRWVVVDVEGNGAQPPELVELAVLPITAGVIGEANTWLVRPPTKITWRATQIHGIKNSDVADAPNLDLVCDEMTAALNVDAIVGHNVGVDLGVLRRSLPDWIEPPAMDTLSLARKTLPRRESFKLGTLARDFNLARDLEAKGAHRAGHDALVTARLFLYLVDQMPHTPTAAQLLGKRVAATGDPSLFEID